MLLGGVSLRGRWEGTFEESQRWRADILELGLDEGLRLC